MTRSAGWRANASRSIAEPQQQPIDPDARGDGCRCRGHPAHLRVASARMAVPHGGVDRVHDQANYRLVSRALVSQKSISSGRCCGFSSNA
jgi:hypothetical protein